MLLYKKLLLMTSSTTFVFIPEFSLPVRVCLCLFRGFSVHKHILRVFFLGTCGNIIVCAGRGSMAQVTPYPLLEIEEAAFGEPNQEPDAEYPTKPKHRPG
jgi:hypothetical protein